MILKSQSHLRPGQSRGFQAKPGQADHYMDFIETLPFSSEHDAILVSA
jgi:hypothetical protein